MDTADLISRFVSRWWGFRPDLHDYPGKYSSIKDKQTSELLAQKYPSRASEISRQDLDDNLGPFCTWICRKRCCCGLRLASHNLF
jgi:hypothetical protein